MKEFYSARERAAIYKKKHIYTAVYALLLLTATAVCAVICTRVRFYNWRVSFALCAGIFTLAGWTAIILNEFAVKDVRAEYRHIISLQNGEKRRLDCVLISVGAPARVPGGTRLCRVRVLEDDTESVYSVPARFANLLPAPGARAALTLSGSCITGCETYDENA